MRWEKSRRSRNVEDRRGTSGARTGVKVGGGAAVVIVLASLLFGIDPGMLAGILGEPAAGPAAPPPSVADTSGTLDPAADFVYRVLGETEDVWGTIFQRGGSQYPAPVVVLYRGGTTTACGYGSAATGPFYCPADQKVYLDLSFFQQLDRLGAPGDFAEAYVVAHEVGHHIQTVTGTAQEVRQLQARARPAEANQLSVRLELQADCYAGVWAHHAQARHGDYLEAGDIEEGLRAAAAIGDDRLQEQAGRPVRPETFTHGTSEQRVRWFRRGLEAGDPNACDTFGGA